MAGERRSRVPVAGERQRANNHDEEIASRELSRLPDLLSRAWSWVGLDDDELEPAMSTCVTCGIDNPGTEFAECPCSHRYCRECIVRLFETANKDESLFPPRCCRLPIPLNDVRFFLPAAVIKTFREKQLERSTVNPTYCHQPSCSAFINPKTGIVGDRATCPACRRVTCARCKGAAHESKVCPEDGEMQVVHDLAREQGWQRCTSCRRLVELRSGCNHIICLCGRQFCYVCGKRWNTCSCEDFHEDAPRGRFFNVAREITATVAVGRAAVHQHIPHLR